MSKRKAQRIAPKALPKATVWVPLAFVFEAVFDEQNLTASRRERLKNASYFILDALSRHHRSPLALEKMEKTGYHNLSSVLLRTVCGDCYKQVLDTLKTAGIIEESPYGYQAGIRSKAYRLGAVVSKSELNAKELSGDVRALYQKHMLEKEKAERDSLAPLAHLTKWFARPELTINVERAHSFIELAGVKIRAMIASSDFSSDRKKEIEGRVFLRLSHQIHSVQAFDVGEFRLSNLGSDERLHSVLTGMKRELRSFVRYDGKYLVSLDIRASQPFLFSLLLRKSFYSASVKNRLGWKSLVVGFPTKAKQGVSLRPASPTPLSQLSTPELLSIMFPGVMQLSEKQIFERTRFLKISWEKDFYTLLVEDFRGIGENIQSRKAAKKLVMWLFFEHRSYKTNAERFKGFETLYPIEAGVIRGINSLHPTLLPVLLQRLESRIMLHEVAKRVSERLPDAVLLTVHDSLLTTPDFASEVEAAMSTELSSITGLSPGIAREAKSSEQELDALASFAQAIFDDSVSSVKKSLANVSYADFRLAPALLNTHASHGRMTTKFNPFFYGRLIFPENDSIDE